MTCTKRQRVVKQGVESFRCLNRECDAHGTYVSDALCASCPLKVLKHKRPCKKIPQRCPECREAEKALMAEFPDGPPEYPSLTLQALTWKDAILRWNRAGRPTRTKEEVQDLLDRFCNKDHCNWYDADKRRCKGCGCKVTDGGIAVLNKLKMATEHCPRDFF